MLQSLIEQKQAMLERRNTYYADAVEKLTDPKVMKERLSSPTLHAVLAATHDLKNVHSVKRAKITLELEAKAWEPASKDGDFTRSEELKWKAEDLDGKLLKMADKIDKKLENSQKASQAERLSNDKQIDEQKKNPYLQQRMENQHVSGSTIDWIA